MMKIQEIKVVIRGGGDLASGVAYRLYRAGFPIIITELAKPLVVRRTVSFAEAVYTDKMELEGITVICVDNPHKAIELAEKGEMIPVLIDPDAKIIDDWKPMVVVDASLTKKNLLKTKLEDAPIVIGLGPGFTAQKEVHAIVETKRGHFLGRVIYEGEAAVNTGIPGIVQGVGRERVIYSSQEGEFIPKLSIGDIVEKDEIVGWIEDTPIKVEISGCIRGLLASGVNVKAGVKVGDVDPRKDASYCYTISDKALAIGGGVMEAVFSLLKTIDV